LFLFWKATSTVARRQTHSNSNNLSRSFPVAQRQRCHGSNSHLFHLLFLCLNVSANSSRTNPANIRSAKKKREKGSKSSIADDQGNTVV
jgi:hypothetical protein